MTSKNVTVILTRIILQSLEHILLKLNCLKTKLIINKKRMPHK